jgi:hypothetical protein
VEIRDFRLAVCAVDDMCDAMLPVKGKRFQQERKKERERDTEKKREKKENISM